MQCLHSRWPKIQVYEDVVENPYEDSGGNEEEALTGVINKNFPAMKEWLAQYLTKVAKEVRFAVLSLLLFTFHLPAGSCCKTCGWQFAAIQGAGSAGTPGQVWLLWWPRGCGGGVNTTGWSDEWQEWPPLLQIFWQLWEWVNSLLSLYPGHERKSRLVFTAWACA